MLLLNYTHTKNQTSEADKSKIFLTFSLQLPQPQGKPWLLSEAEFLDHPKQSQFQGHFAALSSFLPLILWWFTGINWNLYTWISGAFTGKLQDPLVASLSWFGVLSLAEYFFFWLSRAGDWKWKEMYLWRLKSPLQIECIKHLCYSAAWCINSNIK